MYGQVRDTVSNFFENVVILVHGCKRNQIKSILAQKLFVSVDMNAIVLEILLL